MRLSAEAQQATAYNSALVLFFYNRSLVFLKISDGTKNVFKQRALIFKRI